MVIVRCAGLELPKHDRKNATQAVKVLYERICEGEEFWKDGKKKASSKADRLKAFTKALKESLDNAYKPDWHVMAGNAMAFACKKRDQTVGIWHLLPTNKDGTQSKDHISSGEKLMVVIWKSPGIEVLPSDLPAEDVADADSTPKEGGASLRVLQPIEKDVEADSEVAKVIALVRDLVRRSAPGDNTKLAETVRRHLTRDFGTIWHVAVGPEFTIQPAADCRNFILASFKDSHIVCFQHEQFCGTSIQWNKVISSLPWLLVVIVCFGYMTFQNVCDATKPESSRGGNALIRFFENNVCSKKDWETEFGTVAAIAVSLSFVAKKFFKDK